MRAKKLLVPGAISLATLAGVGASTAIGNLASVSAATSTNSSSSGQQSTMQQSPPDPSVGGHVGANGEKEVALTGDTATKAKAAAEAAMPGATIVRVETDAEGATYEAHMKKSDGTMVTVKMDANFKVTAIDSGVGGGGPSMSSSSGSSTTN